MPEHTNIAVKPRQIKTLLNKLGALKKGWPVAKTTNAAKRFKVSEDAFERQLIFYQNAEQIGNLLIGNSPKLYARNSDGGEIYRIKFDARQASTNPADWI